MPTNKTDVMTNNIKMQLLHFAIAALIIYTNESTLNLY